jgi:diguanylate cyclase (GGDEF)-like protein
MLSLKRHIDEIEQCDQRYRAALRAYVACLTAIEEFPAPVQRDLVYEFRGRVKTLRRRLGTHPDPSALEETSRCLESELKEYAERSAHLLDLKDEEIRNIIHILADAAATITAQNEAHASQLGQFTRELETISRQASLVEIRRRLAEEVQRFKTYVSSVREQQASSVEQLRRDLELFRERLEKAEALAFTDALTGVANRAEGERRLSDCVRAGGPFSILFLDLNDFKSINDRWGHTAGDLVLKTFARRLAQSVRPADTVCRWGGDEFLVIFPDCRLAVALERAKELASICSGVYRLAAGGQEISIPISVAVGAAEYCPGESEQDLIARADKFLYREKECPTLS